MARKKLGDLLCEAGVIDERQLAAGLEHQRQWGGRLGQALVHLGLVDEASIVDALCKQLALPMVQLDGMVVPPEVLALVPQEICEKHLLLPLNVTRNGRGAETLHLAMSDPTNLELIDDLAFHTGKRIEVAVASDRDVELAIRRCFYGERPEDQVSRELPAAGVGFMGTEIDLGLRPPPPPPNPEEYLSDRQLLLALVRLLIRKGVISENEWRAELERA